MPGLMIGFDLANATIAQNGVVTPAWNASGGQALASGSFSQIFFIWMNQTAQPTQYDVSTQIFGPATSYQITISNGQNNVAPAAPQHFHLEFTCIQPGESGAIVTVALASGAFDSVLFYFTRTCDYPSLNVGTTTSVTNIMSQNVPVSQFYLADTKTSDTTFYMWLAPNSSATIQSFGIANLSFSGPITNVLPSLIGSRNYVSVWKDGTLFPTAGLIFKYSCPDETSLKTDTPSQITVILDLHWQTLNPNITWSKVCPGREAPGSGWTAAGVFFFVLFIIGTVSCVAGCGYKYTVEKATGWEILPGITYYRQCYQSVCAGDQIKYTPQDDSKGYGATTYQAASS